MLKNYLKHLSLRLGWKICCDTHHKLLAHQPLSAQKYRSRYHLICQWLLASTSAQFCGFIPGKPNGFLNNRAFPTISTLTWDAFDLTRHPPVPWRPPAAHPPSECFYHVPADSCLHCLSLLPHFPSIDSRFSWVLSDKPLVRPTADPDCAHEAPLVFNCVPLWMSRFPPGSKETFRLSETNFWDSGSR